MLGSPACNMEKVQKLVKAEGVTIYYNVAKHHLKANHIAKLTIMCGYDMSRGVVGSGSNVGGYPSIDKKIEIRACLHAISNTLLRQPLVAV